jgi:hypothetical protein
MAASPARAEPEAPPASRGFQLAIRTGAAVPLGQVSGTIAMSDALGVQLPLIVDIGAKPIPNLFVGGFLGVAIGGAAGQIQQNCDRVGVNCTGVGFRGGVLVEYQVQPGEFVNPWFGAGFGYEIGGSHGSNTQTNVSNSLRGFELLHLLGGTDFRLRDDFGVGPFFDGALGRYDVASSETDDGGRVTKVGGDIDNKAIHVWLIFGVRAVLFP